MNSGWAIRRGCRRPALTLAIAAALFSSLSPATAETWRFALIGDTPYTAYERAELPKMLEAIADHHVEFVAHVGDFKNGQTPCDDQRFADRQQLFNASRAPFVYVPGDNEWTDCARQSCGGYDPVERLQKLRSLFWADGLSLGRKKIALERQPGEYAEHSRFRLGPVLFVTLNLPGDDNHRSKSRDPRPEFLARNPVVVEWLRDSFKLARQEKLAGVVLLFQANPAFPHFNQGLVHDGFRDFLTTLRDETASFSGQVVAVHGDSHINRIDQPMRDAHGRTMRNFVRVETFGYPFMGWTHGVIDSDLPTLFRFENHPWPPRQP
ncbi:hypothetical protein [Dechloromonas sp. HYN0024]|uniref:hypothetical protein n=1 Tax=Dechloromonas sp. HYN0024 TaxID=2231055 RepID=UPI000E44FBD2|nr:hypothetical protein [Dechloromonas sp. HYN0024]AXS79928.1 hypothetical protein HYN24_07800 [Dechloromonas sp. HYN0024]